MDFMMLIIVSVGHVAEMYWSKVERANSSRFDTWEKQSIFLQLNKM